MLVRDERSGIWRGARQCLNAAIAATAAPEGVMGHTRGETKLRTVWLPEKYQRVRVVLMTSTAMRMLRSNLPLSSRQLFEMAIFHVSPARLGEVDGAGESVLKKKKKKLLKVKRSGSRLST